MKEKIVSYETAVLAKEKGFNIEGNSTYDDYKEYSYKKYEDYDLTETGNYKIITVPETKGKFNLYGTVVPQFCTCTYQAPTQSLLQKWIREIHHLDIVVSSNLLGYGYIVYDRIASKNILCYEVYQTYEEALEKALFEVLLKI